MTSTARGLRIAAALVLACAGLTAPIAVLHPRAAAAPADQLADTPWPMYMGGREHTGQSNLLGPLFPLGKPAPSDVALLGAGDKFRGSLAIGRDGTVYGGNGWYFCAARSDLSAWKWCTRLRADISSAAPAVAWDGVEETIYLGDRDNTLTAFRPDGSVKWRYNHGFEGDIWSSPAVAPNGVVYMVDGGNIYGFGVVTAINPDGSERWHYVLGIAVGTSSPAVDKNGILYIGDNYGQLSALREVCSGGVCHGELLWRKPIGQVIAAAPVIGPAGTLYVGTSGGLLAIDPTTGATKWKFPTPGYVYQTAALSKNDTLYFGATLGSWNMFYAVDATTGALKWTYGPITAAGPVGVFPIVAADGTVYVAVGALLVALRGTDGQLLWKFAAFNQITASPILGGSADPVSGGRATLYVGASDKILYGISSHRDGIGTSVPPIAKAGADRTAQVGEAITFDGSLSTGTPPLSYTWSFGDGTSASGAVVTHTYWRPSPSGSPYAAILTVNGSLASAQDTALVTVTPTGNGPFACSDSFNRPNSPALGAPDNSLNPAGAPPCPPVTWGEAGPASSLGIASFELRNDAMKGTHVAFLNGLAAVNLSASAKFASVDNNSAPRFGIVLRYQDPGNYYLVSRLTGSTNQIWISKVVGGVETVLAWRNTVNTPVNVFFRLGGTVDGDTIRLQIEGTTWLTAQDTAFAGGGAGIYLNTGLNASSYRVDDFTATGQP